MVRLDAFSMRVVSRTATRGGERGTTVGHNVMTGCHYQAGPVCGWGAEAEEEAGGGQFEVNCQAMDS